MPAAISAPMQTKIIELYENGSKLKDIAQTVAVGRNAVARIVQAHIDKNAAAPKALVDLEFTQVELFKLRYFLNNRVRISNCSECNRAFAYVAGDLGGTCAGCKTDWRVVQQKRT